MKRPMNARYLAVLILNRFEEQGDFLGEVLHFYLDQYRLDPREQALCTELVYGSMRMRGNLDYILSRFSKRPLGKISPVILNILRLGAYQILYLDRIPVSASVNESVKLAKHFAHQGVGNFVNALLRQVVRKGEKVVYPDLEQDPAGHIGAKYSFPEWLIELWLPWLGLAKTLELVAALNRTPTVHVRVNTLKTEESVLAVHFKAQGGQVEKGTYLPEILKVFPGSLAVNDPLLKQGHYYIQDESSALAAHALKVLPGQLVYDLCSAPGGKATHLGELMQNQGKIIAFDRQAERLELVEENARRLGVTIIETREKDVTLDLGLPPAPRVLVDAPCSGFGILRHRPDLRWRKSRDEVGQLVSLQRRILAQAARCVERGGLLLYSTCTINKEENEDQARWFLAEHPNFAPADLPTWFPRGDAEPLWYRQILPNGQDLDGFFMALFEMY